MRSLRAVPAAAWLLLAVVAWAALAPLLVPDAVGGVDLARARQAPGWPHLLGTDQAGRDLLERVGEGLRTSLVVAGAAALVSSVVGVLVGAVAALLGGWVDAALMRLGDAVNALPHLVLGLVVVAMFPGSLTAVIASIALTHWPTVARVVRSETLAVRRLEHVEAAWLAGATPWQVLRRHVLPASAAQAVVAVVLLLPHAVWHESTLSFLGLGLQPDQASLGTLLAQARGEVLLGGWWALLFPALALVLTTLGVAGLGEAVRRAVAPRASSAQVWS